MGWVRFERRVVGTFRLLCNSGLGCEVLASAEVAQGLLRLRAEIQTLILLHTT